jgi:hypothetical protein
MTAAGIAVLDKTGGGLRLGQLAGIFAAGAKCEMRLRRLMQRTQIVDLSFAVAEVEEFGAGRFRDHPQRKRPPALEKTRVLHVVSEVDAIRGSTQRCDGRAARGDDGVDEAPREQWVKVALRAIRPPRGRSASSDFGKEMSCWSSAR